MVNHPNRARSSLSKTARAAIRRHAYAAGYSRQQLDAGLAYAAEQQASSVREGYILAMSRILYGDDDLAGGARFGVADDAGPR